MKIRITSREGIDAYAGNLFPPKTALISITDTDADFAELANVPDFLLQLKFDDIVSEDAEFEFEHKMGRKPTEEEKLVLAQSFRVISDAQAEEIAAFVYSVKNDADMLICQCEYGQSRSAAIAAAVVEHFQGRGIVVFADDRYFPNKLIYKKVLLALEKKRA